MAVTAPIGGLEVGRGGPATPTPPGRGAAEVMVPAGCCWYPPPDDRGRRSLDPDGVVRDWGGGCWSETAFRESLYGLETDGGWYDGGGGCPPWYLLREDAGVLSTSMATAGSNAMGDCCWDEEGWWWC